VAGSWTEIEKGGAAVKCLVLATSAAGNLHGASLTLITTDEQCPADPDFAGAANKQLDLIFV